MVKRKRQTENPKEMRKQEREWCQDEYNGEMKE